MYTGTDVPPDVPRRHFLVLINPVCGQGKAQDEFREHVQPLFDRAEISYDVVLTGENIRKRMRVNERGSSLFMSI